MNEMFTHMHYHVLGVESLRIQGPVEREYLNNSVNEMFTHMHYRVLGVGSLRIQGPVEREYLNNSGQAGQSVNAIEGSARVGVHTPSSRLSSVSAGLSVGIFLIEGLGSSRELRM